VGKYDPAPRITGTPRLHLVRLVVVFLFASLMVQADTFAVSGRAAAAPIPPAEKLLCQYGQWETEYWDDSGKLGFRYTGDALPAAKSAEGHVLQAGFTISKTTLLTAIIDVHVNPNVKATLVEIASPGSLTLVDDKGNYYGPFDAETTSAVNNGQADATLTWVALVDNVELPPGKYLVIDSDTSSILFNEQTQRVPATIVKGVDAEAYANYMDALVAANEPEPAAQPGSTPPPGNSGSQPEKVTYTNPQSVVNNPPDPSLSVYPANNPSFPCAFVITEPMMVTKIMDYHINNGKGAKPGMIGLQEHGGTWYGSWHAYGQSVNEIPNAIWVVTPNFEIPAGSYQVRDNETSTLSADANNRAICEVKVAPTVTTLQDNVTGKYTIDFSLDDGSSVDYPLVLGIVDHKKSVEIGTILAGQPLKFNAAVSDRNNGVVKATFSQGFSDFSIKVAMTFTKKADGYVLTGRVTVLSNDNAGISFSGTRTSTDLPGFIPQPHAGIGKVGSIPGPASAGQAAAGIAFPTLATLLAAAAASGGRSGGGHSHSYAGTGDGQDSGGDTDTDTGGEDTGSPDGGSEEGGSEYSGGGTDTGGMDTGTSGDGSIPDSSGTGSDTGGIAQGQPPLPVSAPPAPAPQSGPQNGESMTVHDSGDGLDKTYVYDGNTGQWINPLTGGAYIAANYAASAQAQAETDAEIKKRAEADANALADGPTKWIPGSADATIVSPRTAAAAAVIPAAAAAVPAGSTPAVPDPASAAPTLSTVPADSGKKSAPKISEDLQGPSQMIRQGIIEIKTDMEAINKRLIDKNIYVMNKFQSDPTMIVHGVTMAGNFIWDYTVGNFTGSTGYTCGDYVDNTMDDVKIAVQKQFPGAKVEQTVFYERSSEKPVDAIDYLDRVIKDNHTVIKVTLPNGEEMGVDFHGHNASNLPTNPPIVRPMNELRKEWRGRLGDFDFREKTVQ
jgi:hypothetical protein